MESKTITQIKTEYTDIGQKIIFRYCFKGNRTHEDMCNICNEQTTSLMRLLCCKKQYICDDCFMKINKCPYCRQQFKNEDEQPYIPDNDEDDEIAVDYDETRDYFEYGYTDDDIFDTLYNCVDTWNKIMEQAINDGTVVISKSHRGKFIFTYYDDDNVMWDKSHAMSKISKLLIHDISQRKGEFIKRQHIFGEPKYYEYSPFNSKMMDDRDAKFYFNLMNDEMKWFVKKSK